MSPALFDDRTLAGNGDAGAVFELVRPAPESATFSSPDGWRVSIREGSAGIVASGPGESSHAAALLAGSDATQQALDSFSARGFCDLSTISVDNDYITAWQDAHITVVRVTTIAEARANAKATIAVGDPPVVPAVPDIWHQSMRFYRQSQLSDDLFDSIRALWLATENLLDAITPQTAGEGEGVWLKRALTDATQLVDFTRYLPPDSQKTLRNQAYKYFYDELRVSIFHAKGSRGPKLPQELAGVADLAERHERLTRFYLDLLTTHTGSRRIGGGMTYYGFDVSTRSLWNNLEIEASDDSTPFLSEDEQVNPAGGVVVTAVSMEPAVTAPGYRSILGTIAVGDLHALDAVRRVALIGDGHLLLGGRLTGDLRLTDVGRFEVQLGMRLVNVGLPRPFASANLE